jgi:hypothetical protein
MSQKNKDNNNPFSAIYTDIQWIKGSLTEMKDDMKSMRKLYESMQRRVSVLETKVSMHDKLIYSLIGAGTTAFVSLILWILSTL